jgi:integrase
LTPTSIISWLRLDTPGAPRSFPVPSVWIERRRTRSGKARFRVEYRLGGRESRSRYAGSFATRREALARKAWVGGELGAMRVPDLAALADPVAAPTLRDVAARWQTSRVDVREATRIQHRTALGRVLPLLGDRRVDDLAAADVAELVSELVDADKARETIRKSLTALAMVLDFAGVSPNPARDRVHVRLPREEPLEPEPPTASTVEAAGWLLRREYLLALLVLDETGVRVGELEAATIGDLDESRPAWLIRAAVAKTRRSRWAYLPADLFEALLEQLPAREDRDPAAPLFSGVTAERLRMAIGRACRDAGVPHFSPHDLRHRRISLLHRQGVSWAEIGERAGQRSKLVTADRYTHVLVDSREVDRAKLLAPVRTVPPSVPPSVGESPQFAGVF